MRVNRHKETESEENTVHNTSIRGYLVNNDMQTTYLGFNKNIEHDTNNFIVTGRSFWQCARSYQLQQIVSLF